MGNVSRGSLVEVNRRLGRRYCYPWCINRSCVNSNCICSYKEGFILAIGRYFWSTMCFLGQAIGRWGNFMNQEAHGGPMSEAAYENFHQYLPDFIMNQMCIDGIMYYPTFLYESLWNILIFIILILLRKYNPLRGNIFLSYVILYSIGRFFIEGLR